MYFLKAMLTCHHCSLLYLPCPVIFLLPLKSQEGSFNPALPSGSPQCARTGLDRVTWGMLRGQRRCPSYHTQGWQGGFQGRLPGGSGRGAEAWRVQRSWTEGWEAEGLGKSTQARTEAGGRKERQGSHGLTHCPCLQSGEDPA